MKSLEGEQREASTGNDVKCLLARGETSAKETLEGQAQAQGSI